MSRTMDDNKITYDKNDRHSTIVRIPHRMMGMILILAEKELRTTEKGIVWLLGEALEKRGYDPNRSLPYEEMEDFHDHED